MSEVSPFDGVSPALRSALEGRGFTALTPVQEAVLDPALAGRDLRIFSQTGSGKTVAVGLAIAPDLERVAAAPPAPVEEAGGKPVTASPTPPTPKPPARPGPARPFALVIAPTRELAAQIARELGWLFAPLRVHVTAVTGGASYVRELAALRRGPLVVVGTPGRLLDHLARKSIDPSGTGVVVLDEADQMLDLGFRDDLEAILAQTPAERRTLLLSATFPREVRRLADACQRDPVVAAGSGAGERHADITHLAHLVLPEEREKALVNLLLMAPGERALVFVRTREGAAELADGLSDLGLPARAIHGDLEQRDRTRTLDAFRSGAVATLVATDVAARGLDVPDVTRVIHADPPGDAEVLTHRSGRTGRAGKKGTSIVLVPPAMRERVRAMLRRAGIEATWAPAPSAADVERAADARLATELSAEAAPEPRLLALAEALLAGREARDLVALLLARAEHTGPCAPAEVTPILPPAPRVANTAPPPAREERPRGRGAPAHAGGAPSAFVPFRINWGERQGADPRRLLALVCRRGNIRGSDVGAIRIGVAASTFEVAGPVAEAFARAVREPDARDPRIHITPLGPGAGQGPRPPREGGPREHAPRDRAPREHAPREGGPREHAPRDRAPREHAPREGGPRERAPREGGGGPRDAGAPRDAAPRGRVPERYGAKKPKKGSGFGPPKRRNAAER